MQNVVNSSSLVYVAKSLTSCGFIQLSGSRDAFKANPATIRPTLSFNAVPEDVIYCLLIKLLIQIYARQYAAKTFIMPPSALLISTDTNSAERLFTFLRLCLL